jgi:hypothetical protein
MVDGGLGCLGLYFFQKVGHEKVEINIETLMITV